MLGIQAVTEFIQVLRQATHEPETADLRQLLEEFEQTVGQLSESLQLRVAGELLAQLSELCAARAEALLQAWEDCHRPQQSEPILTAELLQGVLRQTMTLDLESLVEVFESQSRQGSAIDSVAREVEKSEVLEFVEAVEQAEAALNIAHDEDVSAWSQAIDHWMQEQQRPGVMLAELAASLDLSIVKLWLALLLEGYVLEPQGEFYSNQIWIRGKAGA